MPTVPFALVALESTGAGGLTVRVSVALPIPPALVAESVTLDVPAAAGVPEISPVTVLTVSPAGKPAALKLPGLFVAVMK